MKAHCCEFSAQLKRRSMLRSTLGGRMSTLLKHETYRAVVGSQTFATMLPISSVWTVCRMRSRPNKTRKYRLPWVTTLYCDPQKKVLKSKQSKTKETSNDLRTSRILSRTVVASTSQAIRPNSFDRKPASEPAVLTCRSGNEDPPAPPQFRILPVTLYGPDRHAETNVLLDEGSAFPLSTKSSRSIYNLPKRNIIWLLSG